MPRQLNSGLFCVCADDGGQTVREGDAKNSKQFVEDSQCVITVYTIWQVFLVGLTPN